MNFNRLIFKNKKIAKIIFKIFLIFSRKLNEFQPNFFSNIKKLPKLFLKFFRKIFFTKFFFYKFFSGENLYYGIFFGQNLSFHKNISAKIVFTIFSQISFVFDVCEIFYSKFCVLRIFLFCNFGVRKKKL